MFVVVVFLNSSGTLFPINFELFLVIIGCLLFLYIPPISPKRNFQISILHFSSIISWLITLIYVASSSLSIAFSSLWLYLNH